MIIGLMGKARSGKTSVAEVLEKKYGFKHFAFADSLKEKVMIEFGLSQEEVYGKFKEVEIPLYNLTPREILQKVGTFYRSIYENYWVDMIYNSIVKMEIKDSCCVSDVRYPNEIDTIKELNGYIIKIERENREKITNSKHSSETALDEYKDYDYIIQNNSSLDDLEKSVGIMLKTLGWEV